jgi:glycosyltransferase involved in cell wall biosynthesis
VPETPRLAYIGDVAVDPTYHGSMLLYRLLKRYPQDKLRLVEGNLFPPRRPEALSASRAVLDVGRPRLLHTRFHEWYSRWLFARATSRAAAIPRLLAGFNPDAILTVAHGYSWITAAQFARTMGLPLHLIIHDDWPRMVPRSMRNAVERRFAQVYIQAASRLCVSPFMAEEYTRRYGVTGTVMMPGRSPDTTALIGAVHAEKATDRPPAFAFAGTINSPGYVELLRRLAHSLARRRGRLLIFGPITTVAAQAAGLTLSNVVLAGLVPAEELALRLRAEADVLFVPMSFAAVDEANMRLSFPSKIADYTAVGVPLLICGPSSCSAVKWAQMNSGVAEVVTSSEQEELDQAVDRLLDDPRHRAELAAAAAGIGERDFSALNIERTFHNALALAS